MISFSEYFIFLQGAPYPPGDVPPYPDDNSFGSKNSGPVSPNHYFDLMNFQGD